MSGPSTPRSLEISTLSDYKPTARRAKVLPNDVCNRKGPVEPLLKWPGGKRRLLKFIFPLIPRDFDSYFEPFLGSAALFFALKPKRAILSDRNPQLISTYIQVRDSPAAVIKELRKLRNTETAYYAIRSARPDSQAQEAARLIYLSTLSFNGIHRVNLKGIFNVPYGHKTHLDPCDPGKIYEVSEILKKATVMCQDFADGVASARRGDLVYLDPPYTTAHTSNGFLKYNAKIFTWEDQERLAKTAVELAKRGCSVIVSNADHHSIRSLYSDFEILKINRHSVIAASRRFRRRITECVFFNSQGSPGKDAR